MCVVIDTNTFHKIINGDNEDFIPLKDWILNYDHKVIYGGATYKKELSNNGEFRRYLRGLEKSGKIKEIEANDVDKLEEKLKLNFINNAYNDHHIAAILFISGCKLVCSHDKGFHKLIKNCCSNAGKQKIIQNTSITQVNKIRIYQYKEHRDILNDADLEHCCV